MSFNKFNVFLITGANKGIGFGIAKNLLKLDNPNNKIILTSRNESLGVEAINALSKYDKHQSLDYFKLDIDNSTDIRLVENFVKSKYGYLNCLINNAGYLNRNPGFTSSELAEDIIKTFAINFFGQVMLTESLVHLIKKADCNRQIIFTSSLIGKRTFLDNVLNERLVNGSIHNLENLYSEYLSAANKGAISKFQYKDSMTFHSYGPSKMFINSYMHHLSTRLDPFNIKVNSFNPGWVKTDMGGKDAPKSINEGCDTCLWFIENYNNILSGNIYEERQIVDF